jgi:hypothetical protein
MISADNPVRLFVTHLWRADEEFLRVIEYLEGARRFHYQNTAAPDQCPPAGKDAEREELRRQITPAECVIALTGHYERNPEMVLAMIRQARASKKIVLVLPRFGAVTPVPQALAIHAHAVLAWNDREIVDSIRRLVRNEDIPQWDTIEFTLD